MKKEINLIGMVRTLWAAKRPLVTFGIIFFIMGVVVAFNTPKSYTSTVVLAPEISSGMGLSDGISSLASMVGVDLSSGSTVDAIYPAIYPDILASTDFITGLFDIPVTTSLDDKVETKTYVEHLTQDGKVPFYDYPKIWLRKLINPKVEQFDAKAELDPLHLSRPQYDLCEQIKSSIECIIDPQTNVISISVGDLDPQVAADVADTVQNRLQQYILVYRTQKARQDLDYTLSLLDEAKAEYDKAQLEYANYTDAHKNSILQAYITRQEELESEMELKHGIYTQIAQQTQMARAKVQERTPAFTIIQRASVPVIPSSTPRIIRVLSYVFMGMMFNAIWVLVIKRKKYALNHEA